MYIIEAETNRGTATREYKRLAYAKREAARVANARELYIPNPELWPHENRHIVRSVRIYNTDNPTIDIAF